MTKYRLSEEAHTFTYQIEGRKKASYYGKLLLWLILTM